MADQDRAEPRRRAEPDRSAAPDPSGGAVALPPTGPIEATGHPVRNVIGRLGGWARQAPPWLQRAVPRIGRVLGVLVVVLAGSAIGAALAPPTTTSVGPFQVYLRVVPSIHPGVVLQLPPAGRVEFSTHLAPVSVEATMGEVDLEGARRLIGSHLELTQLENSAADTLRGATLQAALTSAGCALAGAVGLSLLVYRRRLRRTVEVAGTLVALLVAIAGTAAATFDPDKMAQPHFTGLLSSAPYIAGQAESMLQRLQNYRAGLAQIVQGVAAVYATSGDLPTLPSTTEDDVVTLLHVSDIHLNPIAFDLITRLVPQFKVNLVVDTGDITTWGTEVESATLSRVRQVGVPYVFVRGNHDSRLTQQAVAASPNAVVLDGDVAQVAGVVIAGIGDPVFTPDLPQNEATGSAVNVRPSTSSSSSTSPSSSSSTSSPPSGTSSPPSGTSGTASGAGTSSSSGSGTSGSPTPTSGARTPPPGEFQQSTDPEIRAGDRLAGLIRSWDAAHPNQRVTIAAVHEPFATPPLMGTVPLVLAGHFHSWSQSVDKATGTRLMIEGSTGGSGVTATGVEAAQAGRPTPLSATLIYLARRGPRAGQVLAYDQVTVGGLGLASITLSRTVIRPDQEPTPSSTPSTSSPVTPGTSTGMPGASTTPGTSGTPGASSPSPAATGTSLRDGTSSRPGAVAVAVLTPLGGTTTPGSAPLGGYPAEPARSRRLMAR